MGESSDADGTLLMEDGFRCELERFISAPAASRLCLAIIMFWLQKEEEKLTGEKKKRADVVSNLTRKR